MRLSQLASLLFSLSAGPSFALLVGLACSGPEQAATPTPTVAVVQNPAAETQSYRIELVIGPKVVMPVSMLGVAMTEMDQGQPVNRHLEVHIYNRSSGAKVTDTVPTVSITDKAQGTSRGLQNVTACLTLNHREIAPHFGDNLYLPEGRYTIAVALGGESASLDVSL